MNDFPKMLYKAPGPHEIHGGKFDTKIVNDEAEQDEALANGWHLTTGDAKAAHEESKNGQESTTSTSNQAGSSNSTGDDNAPPTREELEQKAKELGIEFAPNIGDKKLAERIEAKLAEIAGKPQE